MKQEIEYSSSQLENAGISRLILSNLLNTFSTKEISILLNIYKNVVQESPVRFTNIGKIHFNNVGYFFQDINTSVRSRKNSKEEVISTVKNWWEYQATRKEFTKV